MVQYSILPLLFSPAVATVISQFNGGRLTGNSFGIAGLNATYDYIIVGGGTAGNLVADRLVQNTNYSVALVEAGTFYELSNGNWSQLPYWSEQWEGTATNDWQPLVDWGYSTVPQIGGQRIHYAQGKTFGGGSARNQMMYQRPTKGAFQLWADTVGDQAYTWDNMLKFMTRSMQFSTNSQNRPSNATPMYDTSVFSPSGGPLHVSYPGYVYPIAYYGAKMFGALGLKQIPGFTTGVLQGWGFWQFTIDPTSGTRHSSEASFLADALSHPGLTVYPNAMARNVLFTNKRATGVNITNNGQQPFTLTARKEVILSAGLYNSPQLLMVSGVGPKQTLSKFKIPVVADLQGVGQGTRDSCSITGPVFQVNTTSYGTWQEPAMMAQAVETYYKTKGGPLTNMGLDIGAFEKFPDSVRKNFSAQAQKDLAEFPADWPEIEYMVEGLAPLSVATDSTKQYASIGLMMVATTSRGNMTISSASNADPPVINPNWLQNETDREVAVASFRRARQAWNAIPIRVGDEAIPGKNYTSDADILKFMEQNLVPTHHGTGSCKMGKKGDSMAVVDSKGRVFGVQNLRVIDSSSMPFTPPGHTMGPTYLHAEKLVQDIISALPAYS